MEIKKKIFITGISSNIIRILTDLIDINSYELIGLTRDSGLFLSNKIKIVEGDLNDPETFKKELEGCYMIFHAAAVTHSFKSKNYERVNFESTKKLILLAKFYKVSRFVYMSSYTAGLKNGAYARSKYLSENFLRQNFYQWTILRPAELFGSHKNIGIEKLINSALNQKVHLCPIQVPIKLQPIHVEEAASLIHDFIFNPHISINTCADIVGEKQYSLKEVLLTCLQIKGKTKNIIIPIPISMMLLIAKVTSFLPIYIGIIPDQIKRLYRQPLDSHYCKKLVGERSIETYINKKIRENKTSV